MWRAALTVGIAVAIFLSVGGATALAAQPNNQACLGEDVSGYAQALWPLGQTVIKTLAQTGDLGSDVQAHLAGLVPDEVFPNSCNDP